MLRTNDTRSTSLYLFNWLVHYNVGLVYFMLSGKLEFDLLSVLLHAGRVKLTLVQAVKVQG